MITVYITEELLIPLENWLAAQGLVLDRVPPHEVDQRETYYAVLPPRLSTFLNQPDN